jgi:hypothetical protein
MPFSQPDSFSMVTGSAPQPDSFDMVTGDAPPGEDAVSLFEIPDAPIGSTLLAFVVRGQAVQASDPVAWPLLATLGGGGVFLDVFSHMVAASDVRNPDDPPRTVAFLSLIEQEVMGQVIVFDNSYPATIIEASADLVFTEDETPTVPAPEVETQQAINFIFCVWSAAGAIDFTPPAGFTLVDSYTSNEFSERTLMIAYKIAGRTGLISAVEAEADPPATGRAFTLVLRKGPPLTPPELHDPVPGNIGLR